jgi:L-ascorbate metabolism protein UlaG (beta-lactamase superfamily)
MKPWLWDVAAARVRTLLLIAACALVVTGCARVNPYYDPGRPHHTPSGFRNNYGAAGGKPLSELLRWYVERTRDGLPRAPSTHVNGYDFPLVRPDLAWLHANKTEPSITWIGHATLLLQVGGLNILTDPHFSERAFAVQWMGPRRRVPLTVKLDELPRIDLVVISHSHYDHLDRDSVQALNRQPGGAPLFLVPLGVERWLADQGITRTQALDWWGQVQHGGLEVHFVPSQHWSARTPFDRNSTLWGGWVIRHPSFSFYFAGDTGYSNDFRDIGERFGGFDLAAIPVGAYLPRWFMKDQHVDPDEAVQIHRDVKSRLSFGIHWGSFELTDEPLDAPIGELVEARARHGIASDAFVLFRHGETRRLGTPSATGRAPGAAGNDIQRSP